MDKKVHYEDENVNMAIELRNQKQKHSDFFFRLHELKERIEVYNEIFRSKVPKFLHQESIAKKLKKRSELQRELEELANNVVASEKEESRKNTSHRTTRDTPLKTL